MSGNGRCARGPTVHKLRAGTGELVWDCHSSGTRRGAELEDLGAGPVAASPLCIAQFTDRRCTVHCSNCRCIGARPDKPPSTPAGGDCLASLEYTSRENLKGFRNTTRTHSPETEARRRPVPPPPPRPVSPRSFPTAQGGHRPSHAGLARWVASDNKTKSTPDLHSGS